MKTSITLCILFIILKTNAQFKILSNTTVYDIAFNKNDAYSLLEVDTIFPSPTTMVSTYNLEDSLLSKFELDQKNAFQTNFSNIHYDLEDNIFVVGHAQRILDGDVFLDIRKYDKKFVLQKDTLIDVPNEIAPFEFLQESTNQSRIFIHYKYASLGTFIILNKETFEYQRLDLVDGNSTVIEFGDSVFLGERSGGFQLINTKESKITPFVYSSAQGFRIYTTYGMGLLNPNEFLYFSTAGLVKGIHPYFDIFPPPKDVDLDTYSGVVYKVSTSPPFQIKKYKRLGDRREMPAQFHSTQFYDDDHIYLGSMNFGLIGTTDLVKNHLKYVNIYCIDSELNINWDLAFYPVNDYKFMYLNGLELLKDGTILCYGTLQKELWTDDRDSYLLKIDKNGNVLAFGSTTGTNASTLGTALTVKTYPNPTSEYLNIELRNTADEFQMRIFDQSGKIFFENLEIHNGENDIYIRDLPNGNYFFQILGKKGIYKSGSFIKV